MMGMPEPFKQREWWQVALAHQCRKSNVFGWKVENGKPYAVTEWASRSNGLLEATTAIL